MLGEFCNKKPKDVLEFASRDKWLDSKEALEYGIIDEVIEKLEKKQYISKKIVFNLTIYTIVIKFNK